MHFYDILRISPENSLTPFEIENLITGESEFLFIANCTPSVYESLKGRNITQPTKLDFTLYNEGDNLIVRFDILDIYLESEILSDKVRTFLSILKNQDYLTLVVVDSRTYEVIWLTNTIPFKSVRKRYEEVLNKFAI